MMLDTRFEIRMPAQHRHDLDAYASELGLSAADVVRLAVRRLIANRDPLKPVASGAEPARENGA